MDARNSITQPDVEPLFHAFILLYYAKARLCARDGLRIFLMHDGPIR